MYKQTSLQKRERVIQLAKKAAINVLIMSFGIGLYVYGVQMHNEYCETTCIVRNCTLGLSNCPICSLTVNATLEVTDFGIFYQVNDVCRIGENCDICKRGSIRCYINYNKIHITRPFTFSMFPLAIGLITAVCSSFYLFIVFITNADIWVPKFIYDNI